MKKLSIFLISVMISFFFVSCSPTQPEDSIATISGQILNVDGDPIFGANIFINGHEYKSNAKGEFLFSISPGNYSVQFSANGYQNYSESIKIKEGNNTINTIILESLNFQRLNEIYPLSNSGDIKRLIEFCGFYIDNNPATNGGFSDSHINMLNSLIRLHKSFSIGEIINELNISGVRDKNGNYLSTSEFINVLNALFKTALLKPNDPKSFILLYLMSDVNGNLPDIAPEINDSYIFSADKAMVLLAAINLLATNPPTDLDFYKSSLYKNPNDGIVQDIIVAWADIPVSSGDLGEDAAGLVGSSVGGLVGMWAGYAVSIGLTYVSIGAGVVLTPYIVGGSVIAGKVFGGWLATTLYKMWSNRIGQEITPDDIDNVVIGENGQLIITSDIRVTLTWEGGPYTDVDIHLIDPNGERTYFNHPLSSIGAELDVDDVDGFGPENITLDLGEAINGRYYIEVNFYDDEGAVGQPVYASVQLTLHEGSSNEIIRNFGPHILTEADGMGNNPNAWWEVTSFDYPSGNLNKLYRGITHNYLNNLKSF